MTAGYLLDLFIINQVRKEEIGNKIDSEVKHDLLKQDGHLLKEIGKMLIDVADGNRPGIFAKHKQYDQGVGEMDNDSTLSLLLFFPHPLANAGK